MLYDPFRVQHDSFGRVDHKANAVSQSNSRGDFVREIHMSRCVDNVEEVRLVACVRKKNGYRWRFDADTSLHLHQQSIRVTELQNKMVHFSLQEVGDREKIKKTTYITILKSFDLWMRLFDEAIDERSLKEDAEEEVAFAQQKE